MTSLISIIIPVYNTSKYLKKCLESTLNQTMQDIEIICVDDCSTDNSLSILKEFQKKDNRIKVFSLNEHSGVSVARNLALKNSNSQYLMFLDSDDWYENRICEKLYSNISNSDNDIAVCDVKIHIDDGMLTNRGYTNERYYATIKTAWVWNKIWKKEIIDKYKINFPVGLLGEDAYFKNAYYIISNLKVGILEEKLYNYLIRKDSLMSIVDTPNNEIMFNAFQIGELTYNFYKEHGFLKDSYQHYFYSMNFGCRNFTEEYYKKIANIIVSSLKTKNEIVVCDDCFEVGEEKFYLKNMEIFEVVKSFFN